MNLNPHRPWITPVVIGAFFLSAVTGVLMFFHLDSGLNKTAHEWLSWAMVIGVTLHLLLNVAAFKRYFTQTTGRVVIGLFVTVLALSFIPAGGEGSEPGFAPRCVPWPRPRSPCWPRWPAPAPTKSKPSCRPRA